MKKKILKEPLPHIEFPACFHRHRRHGNIFLKEVCFIAVQIFNNNNFLYNIGTFDYSCINEYYRRTNESIRLMMAYEKTLYVIHFQKKLCFRF